jgi:hypothetical protein
MVIVEILWHIKKGTEPAFLEAWRSKFSVPDRTKLIGEFLSEPIEDVDHRYKTWRVEEFGPTKEKLTAFVNVALWESFQALKTEIEN